MIHTFAMRKRKSQNHNVPLNRKLTDHKPCTDTNKAFPQPTDALATHIM